MIIKRSRSKPRRPYTGMDDRWRGPDQGLIWCWERGKEIAEKEPEKAMQALSGKLLPLNWRGGLEKPLAKPKEDGTLHYLSQWQGLRNEDLHVDTGSSVTLTCSDTGTTVTFSNGKVP